MTAIENFLRAAKRDETVYISDVRAAFEREGTRPFHCHVRLYDDSVRRFAWRLPACADAEEQAFVASYVHAMLYNILSALGAKRIDIYLDPTDSALLDLARNLDCVFQTNAPKAERSGYGKCLNVNERTLAALCGRDERFALRILNVAEEPQAELRAQASAAAGAVFAGIPARTQGRLLMGMDIGGTDIKIAASVDGKLCAFKEYDWFPAGFSYAEQLIDPILMLTRLVRAAACLVKAGKEELVCTAALDKRAGWEEMETAIADMEAHAGSALTGFDAIGLCFPDVVIRNRIVGGETYKTRGMRNCAERDYEEQFAQITDLCDRLQAYVREGGAVMNTNDGPMAAFTTAVEQAAVGSDFSGGFLAHTLGTELGTGWILADGSIPEIPLEVYNFIIDLGSFDQQRYDVDDVRSCRNFNTGLSGTLQKYTCQSGVFRLAAKLLPEAEPETYARVLKEGLFAAQGDKLVVPVEPADLRKPCLEFFMREAEREDGVCAEIFRKVGEYLAVTWLETQYILEPDCAERTLFGRLVKTQACFDRICEGARRIVPDIRQYAADGGMANTDLMRQLKEHPVYTVAQFAQAVGAIYYGCVGLE